MKRNTFYKEKLQAKLVHAVEKKEAYFQVQNIIQKQSHVSGSFVGVGLHPVPTTLYKAYEPLQWYLTWSYTIEKADCMKQVLCSNAASSVICFTNSKLFSPIIAFLICHIPAPKATLVL